MHVQSAAQSEWYHREARAPARARHRESSPVPAPVPAPARPPRPRPPPAAGPANIRIRTGTGSGTSNITSYALPEDFDAPTAGFTQTALWSRPTTGAFTLDPELLAQLEAETVDTQAEGRRRRRRERAREEVVGAEAGYGYGYAGGTQASGDGTQTQTRARTRSLRRMSGRDRIRSGEVTPRFEDARVRGTIDYELVSQHVLEDGPERTVSLSKWREQVIHETDADDDMSVWFANTEGYLPGRGHRGAVYHCPSDRGENNMASSTQLPTRTRTQTRTQTPHLTRSTPRGSGTLIPPPDPIPSRSPSRSRSRKEGYNGKASLTDINARPPKHPLELDAILSASAPSLAHIAPALRAVGILSAEHLRAIALMEPEIRDREVKKEVLGKGVSVLEWAVLLDRARKV